MTVTTWTLTGDVSSLVGEDWPTTGSAAAEAYLTAYDADGPCKFYVDTATGGKVRFGPTIPLTLASDGTFTRAGIPDSSETGLSYALTLTYRPTGHGRSVATTTDRFTLDADKALNQVGFQDPTISPAVILANAVDAVVAPLITGGALTNPAVDAVVSAQVAPFYAPRARTRRESRSAAGVICISWDDGHVSQWDNLWPLLRDTYTEQRHTFAIYTDAIGTANRFTAAQIQTLHAAGHEIACHSKTHANIGAAAVGDRVTEYDTSRTVLEGILGESPSTFVYPLGNNGRTATTDKELWGRYDRIVNAGTVWTGTPLRDIRGTFIVPRPAVWNSSTHAHVLELIRRTATQPIALTLYAHYPAAASAPDMSLAELTEALDLIETLGIPALNIRDVFPGGGSMLLNPGAESGLTGWQTVQSGSGNTATSETDTPASGYSGSKSFKLVSGGDTNYIYLRQYVPCVEGDAVTFSGRARATLGTGAGGVYLRLGFADQLSTGIGGTYYSSDITSGTFAQVTVAATAPADTRLAYVDMMILNRTATAYFDHLHFGLTRDGVFG